MRFAGDRPCETCGHGGTITELAFPEGLAAPFLREALIWSKARTARQVAIAFSLVPLCLPFPVLAAVITLIRRKTTTPEAWIANWLFILIIACLNMVLSAWALASLSEAIVAGVFGWWQSIIDLLPHPPDPVSRSIPV